MNAPVLALRAALVGVVITGALLVSGCGGGGYTVPNVTPSATPSPLIFTFTSAGGTATIVAGATGGGGLSSGAAVGGVSISSTWGANNAVSPVAMTAQVATGTGDVTSNTSTAFPLFTVAGAVDSNNVALTGAYTPVDYLKVTANPDTVFTQTPGIVVTVGAPASIAGKTSCSYFTLAGTATAPKWQQALTASPSGSTITFTALTLPSGSVVEVGNGATNVAYLALACR